MENIIKIVMYFVCLTVWGIADAHVASTRSSETCSMIHNKIDSSEEHLKLLSASLQRDENTVDVLTLRLKVVSIKYDIAHDEFNNCYYNNNTDFRVCNILRDISNERRQLYDKQLSDLITNQSDYAVKLEIYNDALENHKELQHIHKNCKTEVNPDDTSMDN